MTEILKKQSQKQEWIRYAHKAFLLAMLVHDTKIPNRKALKSMWIIKYRIVIRERATKIWIEACHS